MRETPVPQRFLFVVYFLGISWVLSATCVGELPVCYPERPY